MKGYATAAVVLLVAGCTSSSPAVEPAPTTTTSAAVTAPAPTPAPTAAAASTVASGPAPVLPDPAFTPGVTNPAVTPATLGQTICATGWTATVRPPESYTEEVKRLEDGAGGAVSYDGVTYDVHGFGLDDRVLGHFELDHLIPLELGGSPADPRNLWLEPYEPPKGPAAPGSGSQSKDRVEDAARRAVCAGHLDLGSAQREIAADWSQLGHQLGL